MIKLPSVSDSSICEVLLKLWESLKELFLHELNKNRLNLVAQSRMVFRSLVFQSSGLTIDTKASDRGTIGAVCRMSMALMGNTLAQMIFLVLVFTMSQSE